MNCSRPTMRAIGGRTTLARKPWFECRPMARVVGRVGRGACVHHFRLACTTTNNSGEANGYLLMATAPVPRQLQQPTGGRSPSVHKSRSPVPPVVFFNQSFARGANEGLLSGLVLGAPRAIHL